MIGIALLLFVPRAVSAAGKIRLRVDVLGLSGDLRKNVLSILSIERARKDRDLTEERIRSLHTEAEKEIQTALQPFGYYRPVVESTLKGEGGDFHATYRVDHGPAIKVTAVDVTLEGEGREEPDFEELVEDFPLDEGDVLTHPDYEAGKKAFEDFAAEHGYLDAKWIESRVEVDMDAYTARIALHFDSGPRYFFGPVRFHQDVFEPELLAGYVPWRQGERLNLKQLLKLQDALSGSRYFSRVEAEPKQQEADAGRQVPIDVNLVPGPRRKFTFGVGYGTDSGPRGSVMAELRRLNRHGHHGEAELKASGIEKSLVLKYLVPGPRPVTDALAFTVGVADFRPSTSKSDTFLAGAILTRGRGNTRESLALTYQREKFTVGVDEGTSDLLIPEVILSHLVADDRSYTRRGHRVQLQVRGAVKNVLSDDSFLQAKLDGKLIRPAGSRGRIIGRAELGYTYASAFRSLPPRIRFFGGGDVSVRGYRFQTLGRLDEKGNVIGGETLRTASVEYENLFIDRWGGAGAAVFFDAGNASRTFGDKLRKAYGVGLRWRSPIGFARVDAAFPIGEPGNPLLIHVNIGADL